MKYLGIDYGSKWVGIAISDEEGKIAFPRAEVPNGTGLLQFIARMVEQEKVKTIIVGDTRTVEGKDNPITPEVEKFVAEIARVTTILTEFAPEMWSSIEASRYAPKGQEHNNAAAAAIILQRFLDTKPK